MPWSESIHNPWDLTSKPCDSGRHLSILSPSEAWCLSAETLVFCLMQCYIGMSVNITVMLILPFNEHHSVITQIDMYFCLKTNKSQLRSNGILFLFFHRSYLDVLKYFVFLYLFWVTLAIVFLTGTLRINLFSMGYVIAVFCFMWYGQEFLLKPLRKLLCM